MSFNIKDLTSHPNKLAAHYSAFNVGSRLRLTGHSHQAWPDVAMEGMKKSWDDATLLVDEKWGKAFEKAQEVRDGFSRLLEDENGYIALGINTHELLIRFLSALDLRKRPRIVTTDGEFHTIRRQMLRLWEEGIEVVRVASYPVENVADQIISQINDKTAAVLVSSVFFETGLINPGLTAIAEKCAIHGTELLVDTYHSLNVAPFSVRKLNLQKAFIIGGGYKYCQLGEGNCFLRFPDDFKGRPIITGWFSEFSLLGEKKTDQIAYGQREDLFAGSTYDPVSHYRAAEVFRFFREQKLTPEFLREVSLHQVGLLAESFLKLDLPEQIINLDKEIKPVQRAGFLVLRTDKAAEINGELTKAGVLTDFRGTSLRFGPAPYLSDKQLTDAMGILGEVVKKF
ncbi:MAG: kynureninase [Bacteroidetes bacterium HGW-Bacteroidetes-11]|jgi:selenocysteine lyase/cysteine desulfurase|nr:MAG: kynureninase [Bacteroidetes bacterium HGW-Bacteroidetes-11]